ncbi:uncharacterized protein LOC120421592 [Culex pipiens pallens]|uniref:uncharacterized protein LOC120421592 n=1 Tax=Culex pipiens pallens TaxID=42434 RepID=UPI001952D5D3|nr:uncharacterized protein LOC120421592 [Culex pipiens pallens]
MVLLRAARGTLRWWFPVAGTLGSLSPLYVALKLFGVTLITVGDQDRVRVTLADWCLLAIVTGVKFWGVLDGIVRGYWKGFVDSEVEVIEYCLGFSLIVMILVVLVVPFYVMLHLKRVEDLLGDLKAFDEELKRLGYPRNHRYYHFITTIVVTSCLVVIGLVMLSTLIPRDTKWLLETWLFLAIVNASSAGYTLYHTALNMAILAIHSRLQLMNRCVQERLERDTGGDEADARTNLVVQLAKLYDKLCDASSAISVVFGVPHAVFFINIFFMHVVACYAILRVLLGIASAREAANAWIYLGWSGYFNSFLFQTVVFDAAMKQQTDKFCTTVHRCLNAVHNLPVVEQLLQLAEQVASDAPNITYFLFELHPSVLVQACGELATYLVILIQFDMQ